MTLVSGPDILDVLIKMIWEKARQDDPSLRWICADCHLLACEHPDCWWCCSGKWIAKGK